MAQLVCSSPTCRVVLMYPRGASQVQCSICGTVNCAMAVTPPVLFLQALFALCACPCSQEAQRLCTFTYNTAVARGRAGQSDRAPGVRALPHDAHVRPWCAVRKMRCLQLCHSSNPIVYGTSAAAAKVGCRCLPSEHD